METWEEHTGVPKATLKKAEHRVLEILDWRTWIGEKIFTDLGQRMAILWDIALKD